MTRDEAVSKLITAFQLKMTEQRLPGLPHRTALLLAEEAVCAMGGDLKLEPQIAYMSGNLKGVSTFGC